MPVVIVGTTPVTLIEADSKRKFVSFQNTSSLGTNYIYVDDKPGPVKDVQQKWRLVPGDPPIFITRDIGFPERAFYGVASQASARLVVGFQNEEEKR